MTVMKLPLHLARFGLLSVVAAVLIAAGFTVTQAQQQRRQRANKEFMRDKLELAQRVLEGITMEDYDLVIAKGTKLAAMTQDADWRMFENPDYDQQSKVFKRHVDTLVQAAKKKDLDGMTLAYVRVTMSCVDCHKVVRGKIMALAR